MGCRGAQQVGLEAFDDRRVLSGVAAQRHAPVRQRHHEPEEEAEELVRGGTPGAAAAQRRGAVHGPPDEDSGAHRGAGERNVWGICPMFPPEPGT
ncbi:hypothetical protein GCM10019016_111320 [Streptomyces prasinosporus]|uniref:Uncharacterized protein n=1 Tax=Streptomyces prasinosporus TaxID=68256 RepID=A0ABP6UBV4_9ACTN